jgi:hypothetical protein
VPKNSNAPLLRIVVGLLASAAAVFALIRSQELATRSGAIDFYQFWLIGQFIDQPGYGDVYAIPVYDRIGTAGMVYAANSPSERLKAAATTNAQIYTHKIEPISTPALYAAFKLVSSGDYETDADRYQLACSLVFAVAVVILARAVRFGWTTSLCALAMTLWWFGPFKVDILDGNVARLQLAGLAMAVGAISFLPQRAGRAIAGLLLALNVMFKPNVALVAGLIVLVYAFRREWRAALEVLAGMLGGVMIAVVGSGIYLGNFGLWLQWIGAIFAASRSSAQVYTLESQNCSISRVISGAVHFNASWPLLGVAMIVILFAMQRSRSSRCLSDGESATYAVGVGLLAMLISSPIVWPSYFVFLLPSMIYLARPASVGPLVVARWAVAGAVFLCVGTSDGPWLRLDLSVLIYVLVAACTALLVMASVDYAMGGREAREHKEPLPAPVEPSVA